MIDQFSTKVTNIFVAKLVNNLAQSIGMACDSLLDIDHFSQFDLVGQPDSPGFNQWLPG